MTTATMQQNQPASPPHGGSARLFRRGRATGGETVSGWSVLTLVLWTGCLAVGLLGLTLPYARPRPAVLFPAPVQAELLNVELTPSPPPLAEAAPPPPEIEPPPPLSESPAPPLAPPLLAVAQPSPAIAFPLPVETPARVVEARQAAAAPAVEAKPAPAAEPPVQELVHGQGEGRQPAPDYPPAALRARQEGPVRVRFTVGAHGRVLAAEAAEPSPWPLLNQAALRVVRERWRFPAGAVRLYEVIIRFEIKH